MNKKVVKIGMAPVHPGEFIQTEILAELGISLANAAQYLNVRANTLANLVKQRNALSPELALRFLSSPSI